MPLAHIYNLVLQSLYSGTQIFNALHFPIPLTLTNVIEGWFYYDALSYLLFVVI